MAEPKKRISEQALTVWKIYGIISTVLAWLVLAGLGVFGYYQEWPFWVAAPLIILGLLTAFLFIYLMPKLRWKRWRYEVREQEIELQHGVFIIRRTLIPMIRVQHVDTEQGPILKRYGLSEIKISTAATVHEIPAVEMAEAEEMRQVISALARMAAEDV
ncbi:PH domain-containing protein [Bacillus xiapuensis]|uniref:PH domain-containing protein n=1 Tax=Bacillus xiapuensis TaxID=2014075 RepID=UPI000C24A818|nr:PH domain-containing protein [Bacillus xiapuensis]